MRKKNSLKKKKLIFLNQTIDQNLNERQILTIERKPVLEGFY